MSYIYSAHTSNERDAMLKEMGVTIDDLLATIPASLKAQTPFNIPSKLHEWELIQHMQEKANQNISTYTHVNLLGGGTYDHYIPSVIDAITSRGEFLTTYTPYQPEMSQGLLQTLFEYQQYISIITGLPTTNSSCYDGSTALADAAWMSCQEKGVKSKYKLLIADNLFPINREVLETYMQGRNVSLHYISTDEVSGCISIDQLREECLKIKPDAFIIQTPNIFGCLEDLQSIAQICTETNTTSVLSYNPLLSGHYSTPGSQGFDIVTGNGQPLGIPMRAGGSSLGILAAKKKFFKYMPGRIIGKVTDIKGNPAFALVFEDREQHIAREKATSNICSNQALNAVRAAIYLSLVGKKGFHDIAQSNYENAHYLKNALCEIKNVSLFKSGDFFNEFTLSIPKPSSTIIQAALKENILAGLDRSFLSNKNENLLTIAVTETKSKTSLERFISVMKSCLES